MAEVEGNQEHDDDSDPVGSGRDPVFVRQAQPLLETYVRWFRPEVRGFDRLPVDGPMLVVGNHSGGSTPPDLPILMTAWWRERGIEEPVYGLFHTAFLSVPGFGPIMAKAGALEAGWDNVTAALDAGSTVIVYPGGDHEAFRPFAERDRIDFAGRKGFVRAALRQDVPIVAAVSCGAHDTTFVAARGQALAEYLPWMRRLRIKIMPLVIGAPWLISPGLPSFQLPAKVVVELLEPIDLRAELGTDSDDSATVNAGYELVTGRMQECLTRLGAERPGQRWIG